MNKSPLTVENLNNPQSQVLTLNYLLTTKSKIILPPPGKFVRPDLYVRKRWRRLQYLANEFLYRWRREYLCNLQTREKWVTKRRNLEVRDVVMIQDDNLTRNMWRLGRINKLIRMMMVLYAKSD